MATFPSNLSFAEEPKNQGGGFPATQRKAGPHRDIGALPPVESRHARATARTPEPRAGHRTQMGSLRTMLVASLVATAVSGGFRTPSLQAGESRTESAPPNSPPAPASSRHADPSAAQPRTSGAQPSQRSDARPAGGTRSPQPTMPSEVVQEILDWMHARQALCSHRVAAPVSLLRPGRGCSDPGPAHPPPLHAQGRLLRLGAALSVSAAAAGLRRGCAPVATPAGCPRRAAQSLEITVLREQLPLPGPAE